MTFYITCVIRHGHLILNNLHMFSDRTMLFFSVILFYIYTWLYVTIEYLSYILSVFFFDFHFLSLSLSYRMTPGIHGDKGPGIQIVMNKEGWNHVHMLWTSRRKRWNCTCTRLYCLPVMMVWMYDIGGGVLLMLTYLSKFSVVMETFIKGTIACITHCRDDDWQF